MVAPTSSPFLLFSGAWILQKSESYICKCRKNRDIEREATEGYLSNFLRISPPPSSWFLLYAVFLFLLLLLLCSSVSWHTSWSYQNLRNNSLSPSIPFPATPLSPLTRGQKTMREPKFNTQSKLSKGSIHVFRQFSSKIRNKVNVYQIKLCRLIFSRRQSPHLHPSRNNVETRHCITELLVVLSTGHGQYTIRKIAQQPWFTADTKNLRYIMY